MKSLILGFFLLWAQCSHAANVPQAASVSSGAGALTGAVAPNSTIVVPIGSLSTATITMICAGTQGYTSTNLFGFYSMNAPSAQVSYSVPAGKTFYALNIWALSAQVSPGIQFGYGTAALIAENTATPPAGYVQYGSAAGTGYTSGFVGNTVANIPSNFNVTGMSFPAGAFPTVRWQTTSGDAHLCIQGIVQ